MVGLRTAIKASLKARHELTADQYYRFSMATGLLPSLFIVFIFILPILAKPELFPNEISVLIYMVLVIIITAIVGLYISGAAYLGRKK